MKGTLAAALGALTASACQPAPSAPRATQLSSCDYQLELRQSGEARVQASCDARGPMRFRIARRSRAALRGVTLDERGRVAGSKLDYVVDLAKLSESGSFDVAARFGDSFIAPLSSVLPVPEPHSGDVPVSVLVTPAAGVAAAVGLTRLAEPHSYRIAAHELEVATYFAFGKLKQRPLSLGAATLELTQLDAELGVSFDQLAAWVTRSARAVAQFYGAFPVPRAAVTVLPRPGRDRVVFGKLLPESAPGIALVVGQAATERALDQDWILIHELFHLGFPSFNGEGKWLDEGLATYYEPIIRVRAGLYSERELWRELAQSLPLGLPAFTGAGLEAAPDFRGVYWGGALACLLADVTARQRQLDVGLEAGLRAVWRAGGHASEVRSLAETIATIDGALGAPTLAPIAAAHAPRGSAFDLEALLMQLGVQRSGEGVTLSDSAPLAAVRRAITGPL